MKKVKLMLSIIVTSLMTMFMATHSLAAPVAGNTDLNTEGTISFLPAENPEGVIIQPNESDDGEVVVELPEGGNSGRGLLRIQFVPHFKFGIKEGITAGLIEEDVLLMPMIMTEDPSVTHLMPPFVQVSDERGLTGDAGKWELSVKSSRFVANAGTAEEHTLTDAHILLNGSTLTMNFGDRAKATSLLNGQEEAKLTPNTSVKVLSTRDGKDTSGYQVSNVFYMDYKKNDFELAERTGGVKFVKPAGQVPVKGANYKATLTWTLSDGL